MAQPDESGKLGVPRPNWAGRCVLSFNFHDSLDRDVCYVLKGQAARVEGHQRASNPLRWIVLPSFEDH